MSALAHQFRVNGQDLGDGVYRDAQGYSFRIVKGAIGDPIGANTPGKGLTTVDELKEDGVIGVYTDANGQFTLTYE